MWKITKYLVAIPQESDVIVFNTFTSSLIILNKELYETVFVEQKVDKVDDITIKNLAEMAFIVDETIDEDFVLETIRTRARYYDSDIKMLTIAPTLACNARCFYCYEQGVEFKTMSTEVALALVEYIDKNCHDRKLTLTWFGGEPLLAKNIIDFITLALITRGIEITSVITTNGYLVDEETIEKAKGTWNIRRFQITIDGIGDEYNKIKSFIYDSNAFEVVTENIEKLLNNGIKVNVRINFDPNNISSTVSTISYLKERFGQYPCFFMYVAAINDKNIESVLNSFPNMKEHPYLTLLKKMKSMGYLCPTTLSEALETKYDDEETLRYLNLRSRPVSCYATCLNKFVIDPEGNFYKCHRLLGRGSRFICGNVYEGYKFNDAYKMFVDGKLTSKKCYNCNILPLCQGGCKVKAQLYGQENACIANKTIINDLVKMLAEDLKNVI